jgi:hypothetical protein
MMKKIDMKYLIKILILLVNVVFITLPYSISNAKLENKLKQTKKIEKVSENKQDFYKIYEDFNKASSEVNMSYVSKKMSVDGKEMFITVSLDKDVMQVINFLTYLNNKLPQISISSADISKDNNKISEIVFYIGNSHD